MARKEERSAESWCWRVSKKQAVLTSRRSRRSRRFPVSVTITSINRLIRWASEALTLTKFGEESEVEVWSANRPFTFAHCGE